MSVGNIGVRRRTISSGAFLREATRTLIQIVALYLVSIYGLFADPATIQDHLNLLSGVLPGGALDVIGEQVKRITSKGSGTLGFTFFSGLAISLWSANAGRSRCRRSCRTVA